MPVTIVGLEFAFDQATRTSACKLVRREARVAEVRRTPKLEATAYVLDGKELNQIRLGVVVTPWSDMLGTFCGLGIGSGFISEVLVTPLPNFDWLQKPQIGTIAFRQKSTGEGILFVVGITDPFQHVHAPRLLVRESGPFAAHRNGPGVDAKGQLEGATEVTLTKDDSSAEIEGRLREKIEVTKAVVWSGAYDEAVRSRFDAASFTVQFVFNRDDGTTEYMAPGENWYVMNPAPNPPRVIPVKRPLPADYPQPVKLPGGGWQLTSAATQVNATPPPAPDFPQPAAETKSLKEKTTLSVNWEVVQVKMTSKPMRDRIVRYPTRAERRRFMGQAPVAYSAEGEHLFLVDWENTLYRLRADTLSAERSLPLGTPCTSLAVSQAGLLLALPGKTRYG